MIIFSESYRKIREHAKYQGFSCFVCNRHFKDGEKIGILFTSRGNKVGCRECCMEIEKELKKGE
jgi:hypothetical protein